MQNGRTAKLTAAAGPTTKDMEKAPKPQATAYLTLEGGLTTQSTAMGLRNGQAELATLANDPMIYEGEWTNSLMHGHLQVDRWNCLCIVGTGATAKNTAMENSSGPAETATKDNGPMTEDTGKASLRGRTEPPATASGRTT